MSRWPRRARRWPKPVSSCASTAILSNGRDHDSAGSDNPLGIWDAGDDDFVIPPHGWLLGNVFCRRFLPSLLADGGVGKIALRIAQLISLAIGRSLTGEHIFRRCRVLIVSLEDDRDELRRRVYAVLRYHDFTPAEADVRRWLFLAASEGLKLAEMRDGSPHAGALESLIRDAITRHDLRRHLARSIPKDPQHGGE